LGTAFATALAPHRTQTSRNAGEHGVIQPRKPARVGQKSDLPHRSEDEQRAFFHRALERALAAEESAGIVERCFELAGSVLRIKFAGDRLAECFMPALAHLEIPTARRHDAVFHVWDSESTGVKMVAPICSRESFTDRGDIWGMGSRRFRSAFHWGEFAVAQMDMHAATGIYWTNTASALPYWAKASPLRSLFHWWMESKDCQLVHGAAIGSGGEAVLITGKGGLGKSTTAVSCLTQGLQYVGDDYLVVALDPSPRAHSLYSTAKLNWDQMANFPRLAGMAKSHGGPEGEKAVMYLYPAMESLIARSLPLKAILTPRIFDRPQTVLEPVSAMELKRAAGFTTMSQLPHAGRRTQEFIDRLVDSLPGLQLSLGSELAGIPAAIKPLLAHPTAEIAGMARSVREIETRDRPMVSVIIPVRNGASFLPEAVASIGDQNYPALEIIVVDDGSTDEIASVLSNLPEEIKYIRQNPSGPAAARNRGIRAAAGEFIAFLDVDDLWPPDNLGSMVEAIANMPECHVVRGFAQVMELMPETQNYEFVGGPGDAFPDYLGAALYRRAVFERVGMLDEGLEFGEDVDWFNRAREDGLIIERLEQVTLFVRRHGQNMTHGKSMQELNLLRVLKRALDRKRSAARDPAGDGVLASGE
jgi:GT2 family glycosyltransferase